MTFDPRYLDHIHAEALHVASMLAAEHVQIDRDCLALEVPLQRGSLCPEYAAVTSERLGILRTQRAALAILAADAATLAQRIADLIPQTEEA